MFTYVRTDVRTTLCLYSYTVLCILKIMQHFQALLCWLLAIKASSIPSLKWAKLSVCVVIVYGVLYLLWNCWRDPWPQLDVYCRFPQEECANSLFLFGCFMKMFSVLWTTRLNDGFVLLLFFFLCVRSFPNWLCCCYFICCGFLRMYIIYQTAYTGNYITHTFIGRKTMIQTKQQHVNLYFPVNSNKMNGMKNYIVFNTSMVLYFYLYNLREIIP